MREDPNEAAAQVRETRRQDDGWLKRLEEAPYRFDFYQTLRRIESAHRHLPRLGEALRPADEPIRVGQPAELTFAPAAIHALVFPKVGPARLMQRIFGLIGPNGPLPLHLTELARERSQQHADPTLQRFLDTLTHRFALLFYRAWAQAQPVLSLDRPDDTRFARRLGSLAGLGDEAVLARDAVGDHPKLNFIGRLARQTRDADGLLAWCRSEFDVDVDVRQWRGHWMALGRDERTRLRTRDAQGLGRGAVLGAAVWDVQHSFRIVIGPLPLSRFVDFLPGGPDLARLQAIVRQWVGLEFEWDVQLILARADVPVMRLGGAAAGAGRAQLGRTSWLGHYRRRDDADDLIIDVERTLRRRRTDRAAAVTPDHAGSSPHGPGAASHRPQLSPTHQPVPQKELS
jgi:type VI secretion system protein ImpH